MNKIRRAFWLELAVAFLLSADIGIVLFWSTVEPELSLDPAAKEFLPFFNIGCTVAAVIITVLLVITLRALLKLNMKSVVASKLKMFFARFSGYIMLKLEQWGFLRKNDGAITGQTVSEYDFSPLYRKKERPHRPPRWSKAKTPREKLGYLYYKLITRKIKQGMHAKASDTPIELQGRSENLPPEQTVFDRYVAARYNEKAAVSDSEMAALKKELFDSDT